MKEETPDKATVKTAQKSKSSRWTIVSALSHVVELAEDSSLSDAFFEKAGSALSFLRKKLKMTNIQVVLVAVLVDRGQAMSWRQIGDFLCLRRIEVMTYTEEIEQLIEMGWLYQDCVREEFGTAYEGYKLVSGVVTALRKNKPFVPVNIHDLSLEQFVEYIDMYLDENLHSTIFNAIRDEIMRVIRANRHLDLCRTLLDDVNDDYESIIFMLVLHDYCQFVDTPQEGIHLESVFSDFPQNYTTNVLRHSYSDGNSRLFARNLIENRCDDGMGDPDVLVLTSEAKHNLLNDFKPYSKRKENRKRRRHSEERDLINPDKIKPKDLFYNETERVQIARLQNLLEPEKFSGVQKRLEDEGMRKGFACIFYGAPGTGKTETVLQLARQTGRKILRVDISSIKDKWVGESEKNIKAIFGRYRVLCSELETTPILLFNEADAIFSRRNESAEHSVDKMYNTMQNIILQEMEELDGILIATTNLTGSLDPAFERRFLFKVEFNKPSASIKQRIWKSMLQDKISEADASILSSRYDFSGGQIENIVRKVTVDYVLEGCYTSLERLQAYCDTELLNKTRKTVGFIS